MTLRRIQNNSISADNIRAIREQVRLLMEGIQLIEFELERDEQAGLYSILRHMEYEIWDREQWNQVRGDSDTPNSQRLRDLLAQIKADPEQDA